MVVQRFLWRNPELSITGYVHDINSCKVVAVNGGNGCVNLSATKSSTERIERPDESVTDDGRDEANSVEVGVDDVTLGAVGAVGLPAALIALCTEVRVLRFDGITNQHEYLKYTTNNQTKDKNRVGRLN